MSKLTKQPRAEAAQATVDARKALQSAHQSGDPKEIADAPAHVEVCTPAEIALEQEDRAVRS